MRKTTRWLLLELFNPLCGCQKEAPHDLAMLEPVLDSLLGTMRGSSEADVSRFFHCWSKILKSLVDDWQPVVLVRSGFLDVSNLINENPGTQIGAKAQDLRSALRKDQNICRLCCARAGKELALAGPS